LKIVIFETSHVTLTLTWDDLESHRRECIVDLNKYHYLVCGCIMFHCGRMGLLSGLGKGQVLGLILA